MGAGAWEGVPRGDALVNLLCFELFSMRSGPQVDRIPHARRLWFIYNITHRRLLKKHVLLVMRILTRLLKTKVYRN